jgi:ketosteroid isomerase-like protein
MSQENMKALVTAAHDAFNARDLRRFLDFWAEDCEYTPAVEMALEPGHPYRGHEGLRLYWKRVDDRWRSLRTQVSDVRDVDDLAFVSCKFRATGAESGAELEADMFEVVSFRAERIVRCRDYLDREQALTALEKTVAESRLSE